MRHAILAFFLIFFATQYAIAQETRIFVDGQGHHVEIPVSPQRIVSLRGEQFTAPLIELEAPIVGSTGVIQGDLNTATPTIRGAYDLFHTTFENSGITFIGTPNQPDLEVIASLKPDLILVPDFAAGSFQQLSAIAPTVVINIWSNTAQERYQRIADATGQLAAYKKRAAAFEFRLNAAKSLTKEVLGNPADVTVAIAEVRGKRFRAYKNYGAMSFILQELGFSRPDVIANLDGDRIDLSPELVQSIDADFLVTSYSEGFGIHPTHLQQNWDDLIPGWDQILHAPRNNQHVLIAREPMRALSFKSMEEILAIYVSNIVTRRFVPYGD